MKNIKKILYLTFVTLTICSISAHSANAATRLTPTHLYKWASEGNLNRLHQFQRYINLQDQNHNTALCIAQQNEDKNAYALLLKFGASTKVECHDDNDPICAIIAGEKLKVSPAGWALLGLGAAAGAYFLLENDGGHKGKHCPTGYHKGLENCNNETHPDGWEYTQNGTLDGKACGKCTPKTCPVTPIPCDDKITGLIVHKTETGNYTGNTPCYNCNYTCDTQNGYYDNETICKNGGYTCSSVEKYGVKCWWRTGSEDCPDPSYTKGLTNCNAKSHPDGWTYTSSGEAGGQVCGKCTPKVCVAPYSTSKSSVSQCGTKGEEGWIWTQSPDPAYAGDTACGNCTKKPCNTDAYTSVNSCPTVQYFVAALDTAIDSWNGDTACHKCTYECDTSSTYTSKAACQAGGYTCSPVEHDGVQCWLRGTPESCPDPSYTAGLTNCNAKSHPDGWTYTSSGESGGQVCGKCTPKVCVAPYSTSKSSVSQCGTKGEEGWIWTQSPDPAYAGDTACGTCTKKQCNTDAYTSVNSCPTVQYFVAALDTAIDSWNGDTACHKCTYECDTSSTYTSKAACQAGGYTCSPVEHDGVQCWLRGTPESCPDPSYTAGLTNCNAKSHPDGWTYTSSGESGGQVCGKCTPKTCSVNPSYSSVSQCGSKGEEGWTWTQASNPAYAGDTACGTCAKKQCNANAYTNVNSCPAVAYFTPALDTAVDSWNGDTACHKCTYDCDTSSTYTSKAACQSGGYTCSSVEHDGVQCWLRGTPSSCPTGYTQGLANCNAKSHPDGWTYTSSGESGGQVCGKCTPKTCSVNPSYSSVSQCGTKGEEGWTWTQASNPAYAGDTACGTCAKKQCNANAYTNVNSCPAVAYFTPALDTAVDSWNGDTACHKCTYECDTSSTYTSKAACQAGGYTCSSVEHDGVQCWLRGTPSSCPTGYTQGLANCNAKSHPDGWTYTSSGESGGQVCGKCTPKTCSVNPSYSSVSQCGSKGEEGWTWTQASNPAYAGDTACGTCAKKQCNANAYTNVSSCPTIQYFTPALDTAVDSWNGDTACHKCTYDCDTSSTYTSKAACQSGGYTCSSVEHGNVQCWIRGTASSCPTGYTQGLANCNAKSHPDGWTYTSSGESGGQVCGKCTPKTCSVNPSYSSVSQCGSKGEEGWTWTQASNPAYAGDTACGTCAKKQCNANAYTNVNSCPAVAYFTPALDTAVDSWNGDTACHKCTYDCDTSSTYTSKAACQAGGYTCSSVEHGNVQCWIRGTASSCPTGYTQGLANCNAKSHPDGWTYTSSGESGGQICGKCTAKTCSVNPSYSSVSQCGSKGEEGWTWTQASNPAYAGDTVCGTCAKKQCNANAYTSVSSCPTVAYFTPALDTAVDSWNGDTACYKCTYDCDTSTSYTSRAACQAGGHSCSSVEHDDIVCWVRNSTAVMSKSLTISNTHSINYETSGNDDFAALKSSSDLENKTDENTGSVGNINITHNSTGTAIGMHGLANNQLYNRANSTIQIANFNDGEAIGMKLSRGGSATNDGNITITGDTGTAYGIYGEGENTITNSKTGVIDVSGETAYGIYVKDGTDTTVTNAGIIRATGSTAENAYGIYIDENASNSTVINTGEIYLNGTEVGDAGIYLNGAELHNYNHISFDGDADLNSLGGLIYLEDGGLYEAQSLSGDLIVGTSNVLNGRQDIYINEDALQTENVDNLNITSESAMFNVTIRRNEEGGYDVVSNRQSFEKIAPNKSIANYLEDNYHAGTMDDTYNAIIKEHTATGAQRQAARELGYDVLPNFADENYTTLKSLGRNISDTVLTPTDETNRIIAGGDYMNIKTDNKGLLSGYELNAGSMYTFGDKRLDNQNRLGLGLSITQMNTDYDEAGERKLNIFNLFVPYMHQFTSDVRLASILSVGYGYGDYDRGYNRESDIRDIFYGWNNELRYTMDLNGFADLEPALMLNALGYTEDGFDEHGANGLESKKTQNLSVEAGFGLFLKKNVDLNKYGKLGFKIGGVYYRELANPYDDITARQKGSRGWYKINDYANIYDHDRAVLEASVDYGYKQISLYAKYNHLIQRNNPQLIDLGLKYNF